ncbi:MAG: glycosyltransferase family 4 protein [Armatimonadetes bacterium]|nr:glycosyltransferase family 4 protein [Armatimonadota bacterium]
MNILLAHKYFFRGGGTSTYLFALIDELELRGHKWVPFTVAYDQTEVNSYQECFISPPLEASQTHYSGMKFSPLTMLKILGRATYCFEARSKALKLIHNAQPDIAYIHNIYNYMSPSIIHACRKGGIPIVMRVPDYNLMCAELHFLRDGQVCTECLEHGYKRALRYRCLKGSLAATAARVASMYVHKWLRIYDNVDLFITPSAFMREMMVRAGYDEDKIVHLPSFYPGQVSSDAKPTEEGYILYFGRVAPEKGIDTLIRAMAKIDGSVRLVIAGADVDGTQAKLRQLAADLGLNDVQFVGRLGRAALDESIQQCLFTVVPSRWYDNCPMATLESFAHSKPVIGSNIGGIPEQIADGCGLLFEPDNADDLAGQIQLLVDNPDLRRQMGQAAAERVAIQYSPQAHCDRLLALFEDLIGTHV